MLSLFMSGFYPLLYNPSGEYLKRRDDVFSLAKGSGAGFDDTLVFIMEVGSDDALCCYSLVASSWVRSDFEFGNASCVYFSDGQVFRARDNNLGNIDLLSRDLVNYSLLFSGFLHRTLDYPLPSPAMVRFYILREGLILSSEFSEDDLLDNKGVLSPLFFRAQDLIGLIKS